MQIVKGIPVSPGIAVAVAYCIDEVFVREGVTRLSESEASAEWQRFQEACAAVSQELQAMQRKVLQQVGPEEAEIFKAHQALLFDPTLQAKIRDAILRRHWPAATALAEVLEEYTSLLANNEDRYLKERVADIRDVILRLSGFLSEAVSDTCEALPGPVIVVAQEVLPSQVVTLANRQIAGFVTHTGGTTSHAAILARSQGIPAVSGLGNLLPKLKTGQLLVVDGRDGSVIVHPNAETERSYRKLQREFVHLKDRLVAHLDHPSVSADGESVELLANVSDISDIQNACEMGAAGVGLYRTEFFFLRHPNIPDEQEQVDTYRELVEASPGRCFTIRTLDIGGDKTTPYLGQHREANPFMGWRSVRLSFEHLDFFLQQIRAALRVAAWANEHNKQVQLLLPMITTLEEVRKVKTLVAKARKQLQARGEPAGAMPLGIMIEVPAAAISICQLLPEVDYISIGSNDLVQYLMAADRDNPKVAHLCQPLSPAVLQVLSQVIRACNEAKKPVTLCGEMAGLPRAFMILFGMGLRSFSMSPGVIPRIKEVLSQLTVQRAETCVEQVLKLKTLRQITRYMNEQLDSLSPELKLLDMQ